jgi:hypothetical protein
MKNKNSIFVGIGLMTALLTVPELNYAQLLVCPRNRPPLTVEERRACELLRDRERREAELQQRREAELRQRREAELRQRREAELARQLVGTWYLNGDRAKPCEILGRGFEAKNERGETTRLVYVYDGNGSPSIQADDWEGGLRGAVGRQPSHEGIRQSIEWANGTRWIRGAEDRR